MRRARQFICAAGAAAAIAAWAIAAQGSGDPLERGFQEPPESAKPRVEWHWMNGNISREGIRADLQWMKRIGIGGFLSFEVSFDTPKVVDRRLVYMDPEWKDAFHFAASMADQLGLEMAIAASPGEGETGGPWVPPAQAMKKLVWSETRVEGGSRITGTLPKPPVATGPFQDIPRVEGYHFAQPPAHHEYYADAAVIAWRAPQNEATLADWQPRVTAAREASRWRR